LGPYFVELLPLILESVLCPFLPPHPHLSPQPPPPPTTTTTTNITTIIYLISTKEIEKELGKIEPEYALLEDSADHRKRE